MQKARPYLLPIIFLGIFIFCFYPALESLIHKWDSSEDYAHAFLVVPIICYIVWQKKEIFSSDSGNGIGLLLAAFSVLFYLFALQLQVPTIIFFSMNLFLISTLFYFAGMKGVREMVVPILLLFMIIPIPNQVLAAVTATLQLRISEASEIIIRAFSIPMLREGNILHIQKMSFQVVDACSGIRSLISMTTLSVIIGYFTLRTTIAKILLFVVSIPVAILINILRVVGMVLVYHYIKLDLAEGALHTATGMGLFVIGLVILFIFQRVLELWETKKQNR